MANLYINGKYEPSGPKEKSWKDNRNSDWDLCDKAFRRQPRHYIPQRSLMRRFEDEYCNRDYELKSIDKPEDTQAEACRRYLTDQPSVTSLCYTMGVEPDRFYERLVKG